MIKEISSFKNATIKHVQYLYEKSKYRRTQGYTVIEGQKEIRNAIAGGVWPRQIFLDPQLLSMDAFIALKIVPEERLNDIDIILLTGGVYQKLAYRENTEGLLAVVPAEELHIMHYKPQRADELLLIAQSPEKPGNIGALLRTADAVGADAIIIADPLTDIYNPNVIRASLGTLFSVKTYVGSSIEVIKQMKNYNIRILAATPEGAKNYTETSYVGPIAIAVGAEHHGLSGEWLGASDQNIVIPMFGIADSLNVSVSAAIILYEALRQRK